MADVFVAGHHGVWRTVVASLSRQRAAAVGVNAYSRIESLGQGTHKNLWYFGSPGFA